MKYSNTYPALIVSIGMLIFTCLTYYPGILTVDSEYQLQQALKFSFSDWHPPIMGLLWYFLNHIYQGPALMLLLHNLIFWVALFLFSLWVFPERNLPRILLIIIFGLLPVNFAQLGIIIKDVAMTVCLFLAAMLLVFAGKSTHKLTRIILCIIITLLLFYAFAVRLNALPAVFVLGIWLFEVCFKTKMWRNILLSLILMSGFYLANKVITYNILHARHYYPFQQVEIHDLAAISVANKQVIFPQYLAKLPRLTLANLTERYSPMCVCFLIFKDDKRDKLTPLSDKPENISALGKLWIKTIIEHPWDYCKHRYATFKQLMISCETYLGGTMAKLYETPAFPKFFYNTYNKITSFNFMKLFFRGWFYVINCIVIGVLTIIHRKKLIDAKYMLYIAASGFIHVALQILYVPSCEFRYLYWTAIASTMILVLFVKGILTSKN